jgi:hypothetical protein
MWSKHWFDVRHALTVKKNKKNTFLGADMACGTPPIGL